jgi:hypothetical protein
MIDRLRRTTINGRLGRVGPIHCGGQSANSLQLITVADIREDRIAPVIPDGKPNNDRRRQGQTREDGRTEFGSFLGVLDYLEVI